MPRTPQQFDEIRENRKAQIMEKALDLFSREGYGHVSISMLAKEAGISKGLMYNYFESKDELLKEIINNGIEEIIDYFDPNQDGILTPEEFELFIRKTFQIMHDNQKYWLRFYRLIIQPKVMEHLRNSSMIKFLEQYFKIFEDYFRRMGFEDPLLEIFSISVIIEGMGAIMIYTEDFPAFPEELYKKFEDRIIEKYTKNHENK